MEHTEQYGRERRSCAYFAKCKSARKIFDGKNSSFENVKVKYIVFTQFNFNNLANHKKKRFLDSQTH